MDDETVEIILRADTAVGYMQRPRYATGISAGDLRSGVFSGDGKGLETLGTLADIGLARKGVGNLYSLNALPTDINLSDGYLEPLWRVAVGIQSQCHAQGSMGMSGLPLTLLQRGGVGREHTMKRSKQRVEQALRFAKAANLIEDRVEGGARTVCLTDSRLATMALGGVERFLRIFKDAHEPISQAEVMAEMRRVSGGADPFLGNDDDGARRALRIMAQSGLLRQSSGVVEISHSNWRSSL